MLSAISVEITPDKYGSSEKYSKFLPHNGECLMFTPVPNATDTFCSFRISFGFWMLKLHILRKRKKTDSGKCGGKEGGGKGRVPDAVEPAHKP